MTRKKQELDAFEQGLDQINPIQEQKPEPKNLHEAVINVMKSVKNIDKSMTVGEGKNSYKGVADKDVKYIIGQAMADNKLTCLPIDIVEDVKVDRWTEETNYGIKQKQSIFTKVKVTYRLTFAVTGEHIDICGYGHGVDSQDKSAGKAMTYALKNALLYSFLVPTGAIDDTDNTHSNNIEVPVKNPNNIEVPVKTQKPNITSERFQKALSAIAKGEASINDLKNNFTLTAEQQHDLNMIDV
jgi:CxxC motif-containing protein